MKKRAILLAIGLALMVQLEAQTISTNSHSIRLWIVRVEAVASNTVFVSYANTGGSQMEEPSGSSLQKDMIMKNQSLSDLACIVDFTDWKAAAEGDCYWVRGYRDGAVQFNNGHKLPRFVQVRSWKMKE